MYGDFLLLNTRRSCSFNDKSIISSGKKVDATRRLVKRIAGNMDIPEHPVDEEVRELLKNDETVRAVKRAREELGLSLIEVKQYVDRLKE
ncbi:hypothetical protein [Bacillus sp. CGMCC 1.16541]|uniref:hypothetical protein n=1 Tax=Bacillus sp. CGMCC 1.16541 TaxID=2185143 RepID=UPI000D72BB38|nr:hypothetical protein [Bacillus sp. CGMCC 1.16541]